MSNNTRVAVLGTLAEFHQAPIPYDMQALVDLVVDIRPDLLCLDMTAETWKQQDASKLPPEYYQALVPLAYQTDMVIVPIGGEEAPGEPSAPGWRGWLIGRLRAGLTRIQQTASSLDAINHGWRHDLANLIYHLIVKLSGSEMVGGRKEHTAKLSERVLAVARENPGSRVLVVVNVQYCHHIRPHLRQRPDVTEVKYTEL